RRGRQGGQALPALGRGTPGGARLPGASRSGAGGGDLRLRGSHAQRPAARGGRPMIRRRLAAALRWLVRQLEGAETVTTHHPVVVVDDEALAELLASSRQMA